MKLLHKITAVLAAAAMLLPLTGCGGNPLTYRYDYDLSEYIKLAEYKNIPYTVEATGITEEDVQNEIMSTVMYFAKEEEVDRAAMEGDTVKFSCTVTLDGKEVADFCEEEGSLVLGFATYGDDVEKALLGSKAGAVVEADRQLSDSLSDEALAGKTVHYEITVTGVYETVPPTYNDIFVKAYLGFDTAADYEAAVRETLEKAAESNVMTAKVMQCWAQVVENTEVIQYPEKEMNQIVNQLVADVEAYTQSVGINMNEYIQIRYGMTEEEFRANAAELAQNQMKEEMITYAIARAEKLKITSAVYEEYAQTYVTNMGLASLDELESVYAKEAICEGILGDLVKECVANYAVPAN